MEVLQLIKDIKNKTWQFFVLSVLLIGAVGCQTKKSDNGSDTLFENVCLIPDSLRTLEQQQLADTVMRTYLLHLQIRNNHFVFDMSKEDFLKKGIPEPYYDWIMSGLEDNNRFIDENPEACHNMDSMLKASYKDLYQKYDIPQ